MPTDCSPLSVALAGASSPQGEPLIMLAAVDNLIRISIDCIPLCISILHQSSLIRMLATTLLKPLRMSPTLRASPWGEGRACRSGEGFRCNFAIHTPFDCMLLYSSAYHQYNLFHMTTDCSPLSVALRAPALPKESLS